MVRLPPKLPDTDRDYQDRLLWQESERTFRIHLPPDFNAAERLPVVMVFHGGRGNGENAQRMSDMDARADCLRFIAVYPNGTGIYRHTGLVWNAGVCCGYAVEHGIDDVGFIEVLIDMLIREMGADPDRIYLSGLSNGAMMAHRFACEKPERIAAIAPVSGMLNCDLLASPEPVSVIEFHGRADEYTPYAGGKPNASPFFRMDRSIPETIAFWVERNGCTAEPVIRQEGPVRIETYSGGRAGSEVILYTIRDEGHTWPGGRKGAWYGNLDEPTQLISATDLMLDFFFTHPKRRMR